MSRDMRNHKADRRARYRDGNMNRTVNESRDSAGLAMESASSLPSVWTKWAYGTNKQTDKYDHSWSIWHD